MTVVWRFATPAEKRPARMTETEKAAAVCPEWEAEMVNGDLAGKFEQCRAANARLQAKIDAYESWVDVELDAQRIGAARQGARHGDAEAIDRPNS